MIYLITPGRWIYHFRGQLQAGPDPGRCNRCKCIGQKKNADAFIGQIFTANNKKQHFFRKHKAYNAQISTMLLCSRNDYDTYSKFTCERFVFPKTCPRTITLKFPPLIYTAMFHNLLFNNVNIKSFIFHFVYVFESACIKCVYAITHMSDYPLYVKYNQLRPQIYICFKRKLIQTSHNIWLFFSNTCCVVNRTLTC